MTTPENNSGCRMKHLPAALAVALLLSTAVQATPIIRTNDSNRVPACVTPERLMAFLHEHNDKLDPKYREIARWYKYWGEAWHVRWDYAFYQMVLETNYLKFRRGDGKRGDVHEKQNNFAGLGATGGGVAGERFPDIKTGVLAQIQHLVAYSGERLAQPVAQRTQLKQDDIVSQSQRLRRPVTFTDLARRWAADRAYGRSIDTVAELYRTSQCVQTADARAIAVPTPQPARRPAGKYLANFPPPNKLGGPKPDMLAGPDTLPWQETQAATTDSGVQVSPKTSEPAPKSAPDAPVKSQPEKKPAAHNPPVRTIWSRDGAVKSKVQPAAPSDSTSEPKPPPQRDAPAADVPSPAPKPQASTDSGAGTSAESQPPPASASPPAAPDEPVSLPEFKIKPSPSTPQHLGGPVAPPDVTVAAPSPVPPAPSQRMGLAGPVPAVRPSSAALPAQTCRVLTASYGGKKTLLVRAIANGETRLTALTVLDGFEKSMFDIYAKASAPGAELIGEYASKDDALADARANCPGG